MVFDTNNCLDNIKCLVQTAIHVLQSLDTASTVLDATRLRILAGLRQPESAAGVARALGLPRQRVGYHVRALEKAGLLLSVGERRKGGTVERLLQATARSYVVSPEALGILGTTRAEVQDRFSSAYQVAATARTLRDLAILQTRAAQGGKRLPTLTLETEVCFASAEAQTAFAAELTEALAALAARYHQAKAPGRSVFRFVLAAHPALSRSGDAPPPEPEAPRRKP
ncbi:MAG: ArsR/SmtB family transcription factor [Myxococcaceae bacterium]